MTALTARELHLAEALHRAARNIRGELDCLVDAEASFPGDPERQRMIAEMETEVDEYGISINSPFVIQVLPADYWVGNT